MSLGLHVNLRKKLTETLIEILPHIEIVRGIGVTEASRIALQVIDRSLPGHGEISENLYRWISDQPLSDFLVGAINNALMTDQFVDGSEHPITSVPGWSDVNSKAEGLINDLENLPCMFLATTSAPDGMDQFLEANDGEFRLSKAVRVALASDKFPEEYPVTTDDEERDRKIWGSTLLGDLVRPDGAKYEWKGAYLQVIKQGFIGRLTETVTEHDLIGDFKALWGVQLALGLATRKRSWSPFPAKRKLILHRRAGNKLELMLRIELDTASSQLADEIKFDDWLPKNLPIKNKIEIYKREFDKLDLIFASDPEAERLRLAARWLFDSYATENELLAYVQAMVCLEIILGDASLIGEIGLGELLRNRCAYLIGKTSVQRNEILKDFKEIYDVRSHIVHRGKNRISARERGYYSKLIWYCKRCIQEELNLLQEAKRAALKSAA